LQVADGVFATVEEELPGLPQDLLAFGKALAGDETTVFGEDCLKLNVWTKPQSGETGKAVMIWIYGGAFSAGSTSAVWYSPARYAADHDVVAVSFNYRLSMFGFPMATFSPEKNPGLLDQRLALEWVRDNIAAFGGDPKR
jgi:carboxylesterase type B